MKIDIAVAENGFYITGAGPAKIATNNQELRSAVMEQLELYISWFPEKMEIKKDDSSN